MAQNDKKSRNKKDVTLRVRVPSNLKEDFEAWCLNNEHSMSRVMRLMIRTHLTEPDRIFIANKEDGK